LECGLAYAALKRRSSTVLRAFVSFSATCEAAPFQNKFKLTHYQESDVEEVSNIR
jgi:hypothetical protein